MASPVATMKLEKFKAGFFNPKVIESIGNPRLANKLGSLGAKIRQTAIRSIRRVGKRGKPSNPGTPPKHRMSGSNAGLRRIYFAYAGNAEIVVGPMLFNQKQNPPATEIQEKGGLVDAFMGRAKENRGNDRKWYFASKRSMKYLQKKHPTTDFQYRRLHFEARPFMAPAMRKTLTRANLREAFAGAV